MNVSSEELERGDWPDRAAYKNLTDRAQEQDRRGSRISRGAPAQPRSRGAGWHRAQKYDERFMNAIRRTGVPHREHGSPSWP